MGVPVCYHGLTFINLIFSRVLLFASPRVCLPQELLQVLMFLFLFYLSIQHFCNVLSLTKTLLKNYIFLSILF